ncbi:hypothetical protein MYX64_08695 [Nitrospinae bacterium AH_259_B05_G02_I21]|nr:hypothetical protein [Nitrospinae bacterium AH_259_B05_G02_I21]
MRWKFLPWGFLGLTGLMLAARPAEAQRDRRTLPPLSDFAVIEEKNLFHPDRLPQVPSRSAKQPGVGDIAGTRFVLHGVILYDNGPSLALLQEPRLTEKKVKSLAQGEKIGPYVLKTIKSDRVVMALGDEEFEVVLYKPKKPKSQPKRPGARAPSRARPKPSSKPSPTRLGGTPPTSPPSKSR